MGMGSSSASVAPPPSPKAVSGAQWKAILKYMPKLMSKDFASQQKYMPKMIEAAQKLLPAQEKLNRGQINSMVDLQGRFGKEMANLNGEQQLQVLKKFGPQISDTENNQFLRNLDKFGGSFVTRQGELSGQAATQAAQTQLGILNQFGVPTAQALGTIADTNVRQAAQSNLGVLQDFGAKTTGALGDLSQQAAEQATAGGLQNFDKYGAQAAQAAETAAGRATGSNTALLNKFGAGIAAANIKEQQASDPRAYAARELFGKDVNRDLSLGTSLTPKEEEQFQQQVRAGQAARGNVLGNAPITSEVETTGAAGRALYNQRLQNAYQFGQTMQTGPQVGLTQAQSTGSPGLAPVQQTGIPNLSLPGTQQAALPNIGVPNVQQTAIPNYSPIVPPTSQGLPGVPQVAGMVGGSGGGMPGMPGGGGSGGGIGQWYSQDMIKGLMPDTLGGYNANVAYQQQQANQPNPWMGAAGGAMTYGAAGAQAGSMFGPYGTLIGGAVGAVGGGLYGGLSNR